MVIPIAEKLTILELEGAIERYEEALGAIEEAAPKASTQQILKVLLARDAVAKSMRDKTKASEGSIATLIELDSRLQKQAKAFPPSVKLAEFRQSLKPPESAWWWFLQTTEKVNPWDRFDWAWHTLTVACLVLTGTFASQTAKAFSANGMDLFQTFGTISQGAGLVLVTGGALTDKGQKAVKNVLTSLKIPPHFHAEATCGVSAVLLLATYGLHQSLPVLGEGYYLQGNKHYDSGELSKALNNYQDANNLMPDRPEVQVAVGKIYESLGQFEQAKSYYQKGLMQGDPASFNGFGRVMLQAAKSPEDAFVAETYFQLALKGSNVNNSLKAELYTNLGEALVKRASAPNLPQNKVQELRAEAEQNFNKAIALYPNISQDTPEWGMAHCNLAVLLQKKDNQKDEIVQWEACKNAKPETIAQYQMILNYGGEQIAAQVDTTKIVDEDSQLAQEEAKEIEAESQQSPPAAPKRTDPARTEKVN